MPCLIHADRLDYFKDHPYLIVGGILGFAHHPLSPIQASRFLEKNYFTSVDDFWLPGSLITILNDANVSYGFYVKTSPWASSLFEGYRLVGKISLVDETGAVFARLAGCIVNKVGDWGWF